MDDGSVVTAIAFFACLSITVWSIAAVWMKRIEARGENTRLDSLDEKLTRIDAAVDVIALEVERISEAQRFTARLLAERKPDQLPPPGRVSDARVVTPH
jgi:hypothetical protein